MEPLMNLSDDQLRALEQGQVVRVLDPKGQLECVLLRADVYDRVKARLPDFDPREAYPALDEAMREDWSDPRMADYDDYESHRP